ncbi:hypothetical protein E5K00_19670 [Hymenobacter aquaticus]|uniref:Coproporphyrinogen III oxidase n=1 Tax=Hymenobacter aquaticus TaxID=1867101 RepID=A0A4Z0PYY3_9BACT|nr:hypothetical protein [Hymenobacter aquaticus]TGE22456.1 hypothetical protein E5K00_19670 [Hymenobacter aquaticus]
MKLTQRFVLAALLGTAAALTTACDRSRTPGEDRQNVNDFSTAPPARTIETNMDSVNGEQNVQPATGKGSAPDQMQSVDSGLESAPGGTTGTATPTAPAQPTPIDKATGNQ